MRIALGAGHNGYLDYGAINQKKHLSEYIEACKIVAYLNDALWLEGYEIVNFCGTLKEKVNTINRSRADCALEIHLNSSQNINAKGALLMYYPTDNSKQLAREIEHSFGDVLSSPVRGSFEGHFRLDPQKPFLYILRKTKCPTVVVEPLFISSSKESDMLENGIIQRIIAQAIAIGIKNYAKQIK